MRAIAIGEIYRKYATKSEGIIAKAAILQCDFKKLLVNNPK